MSKEVLQKQNLDAVKIKRDPSVEEGDYVCVNDSGHVEKASRNSLTRMPAVGKVIRVHGQYCYIKRFLNEKDYTDVTPRATFYIGLEGKLTDQAPDYSEGDLVEQIVGYGLSDEVILIGIDPTNAIILTP